MSSMDLAIYGAQGIALGTYEAIHHLYPIRPVRCFLVTELGSNPKVLSNLPVLEVKSFASSLSQTEKDSIEILIATPENVMPEIERHLDSCGLFCHVRLTSTRWAELMSYHGVCEKNHMPLRALPVGYHRANLHLYMAKFYRDKPLVTDYSIPEWVTPIQVGAALCEERVANLLDCDGEHISEKNANYSELTALYWIWKNRLCTSSVYDHVEYYGLTHYRRILELTEDDILRLVDNKVDVVLPYPMPYEPDIEMHHKRYVKTEDWQVVLEAIAKIWPEDARQFKDILKQRYFYNYNIVLARKEVLKAYCGWLFPILEYVELHSSPKGQDRADRYMGYIAESLETYYFMACREKLCITHAGCRFLI